MTHQTILILDFGAECARLDWWGLFGGYETSITGEAPNYRSEG